MYFAFRFATLVYALTVLTGGYLAVTAIRDVWRESTTGDRISTLAAYGTAEGDRTLLVFDAIEPAGGQR